MLLVHALPLMNAIPLQILMINVGKRHHFKPLDIVMKTQRNVEHAHLVLGIARVFRWPMIMIHPWKRIARQNLQSRMVHRLTVARVELAVLETPLSHAVLETVNVVHLTKHPIPFPRLMSVPLLRSAPKRSTVMKDTKDAFLWIEVFIVS
jgi:hypothetical protein